MTNDEIRNLAIEHHLIDGYDGDGLVAIDVRLIAYTAAVEARERERCRLIASEHPHHYGNAISLMIEELKS